MSKFYRKLYVAGNFRVSQKPIPKTQKPILVFVFAVILRRTKIKSEYDVDCGS